MLLVDEGGRGEDELVDPVGEARGDLGRDHRAGVVADDGRALDPERIEDADGDLGPALDRVRPLRLGRVAEPDRVHRDRVEPVAEDRDDVAVLVPGARRLVEEQHRTAGAGLGDVDRAGRHGDERAADFGHRSRAFLDGRDGSRPRAYAFRSRGRSHRDVEDFAPMTVRPQDLGGRKGFGRVQVAGRRAGAARAVAGHRDRRHPRDDQRRPLQRRPVPGRHRRPRAAELPERRLLRALAAHARGELRAGGRLQRGGARGAARGDR